MRCLLKGHSVRCLLKGLSVRCLLKGLSTRCRLCPFTPRVLAVFQKQGSCSQSATITDAATCKQAAGALGLTWTKWCANTHGTGSSVNAVCTHGDTRATHMPYGCSVNDLGNVYFYSTQNGPTSQTKGVNIPLCLGKSSALSTMALSMAPRCHADTIEISEHLITLFDHADKQYDRHIVRCQHNTGLHISAA